MVLLVTACVHAPPAPAPPVSPGAPEAEARAWLLRVEVAAARGDLAEAYRASTWVARLYRSSPWAWVHAADLQLRAGRADSAAASAFQALARAPDLPEAHRVAGLAAVLGGEPARALPHLERARGLPGVDAARVRALVALDRPADALAALAAWRPADGAARLERAALALELDRADEALDEALALLDDVAVGPDAARLALAAGRKACRLGELHAAAVARVEDPRWSPVLGEIARATGDAALLARVTRRDPDPAAHAALLLAADPEAALAWLGDAPAPALRGQALARLGRLDEAVAAWSALPAPEAAALEGDALLAAGKPDAALARTAAHADDPSVAWVRAGALAVLGRADEAVAAATTSARGELDAAVRELRVRELLGDAAGADRAAERALALDRCQPDALVRRALAEPPCDAALRWALAARVRPADPTVQAGLASARAACGGPR